MISLIELLSEIKRINSHLGICLAIIIRNEVTDQLAADEEDVIIYKNQAATIENASDDEDAKTLLWIYFGYDKELYYEILQWGYIRMQNPDAKIGQLG